MWSGRVYLRNGSSSVPLVTETVCCVGTAASHHSACAVETMTPILCPGMMRQSLP